mgnify:CR=1 FL=1
MLFSLKVFHNNQFLVNQDILGLRVLRVLQDTLVKMVTREEQEPLAQLE